jgi:LCP family protein required for cell wall assembly
MKERKQQPKTGSRFPGWLIKVLAGGFILAALLSIYLVYTLVRDLSASWSETGLPSFGISQPEAGVTVEPGEVPEGDVLEQLPEAWSGNERVTILLMGLDYHDWRAGQGPPRTDSMMLLTIDPITKTAGMMSIPRDLWVEIPGYGHGRINTAYFLGEQDRLPGGGPALAVETVEKFLGVPIQYYVQIDFYAFIKMIDHLGGVEVDVPESIRVDPIALIDGKNSIILEPGTRQLNGELTLAYARARESEGADFDRAARQQQVALAIRNKILRLNMIPTLIAKAPALYNELAEGINTNMSLEQMIALGVLAMQIEPGNIARGVIAPPEMVTFERVLYGGEQADVLKPVPDKIRELRDQIFAAESGIGPAIEVSAPADAADIEDARIAVLNGAGEEGLAGKFADELTALGFNVTEVANADRMDYPTTRIIDYTGNPYTTQYLVDLMDLTQSQILFQTLPDNEIDLALVVGYDWVDLMSKLVAAQQ